MHIFIPIIIVVGLGIAAGIILTIASKLMYVPENELVTKLKEVLPGANCGACGFAGCDDYATALAEDETHELSSALCPVGGAEVAENIATALGIEAEDVEPKVAVVYCNGNELTTKIIMDRLRINSCKEANQFYGGHWACSSGCLGLKDCMNVCDYGAINTVDGLAVIDRDLCVGCGVCAKACPKKIISIIDKKSYFYVTCNSHKTGGETRKRCKAGCIGCMKCQKICKFEAITVEDNLAKVDYEKCRNCGLCVKECPTGVIANVKPKKAK